MSRGRRKTAEPDLSGVGTSVENMGLEQRDHTESVGRKPGDHPAAYSIPQFAAAVGLSRRHVWTLLRRGEGPRIFRVGRRVLVSGSAVEEWISRMEGLAEARSTRGDQAS
jgi:excisionase family DNA binding protein